jgi:outer membrane protein TolC
MKNNKKHIQIILILISCFLCQSLSSQTLEDYIKLAQKNSPTIQKFELKYKIASEKKNAVNTLPNTEVGVGFFISEPETRTGAQQFKISAKQMIPWFGSVTARENYASSLADAKYEDVVIANRKLLLSVSQSYYKLYSIKEKRQKIKDNSKLLKIYEGFALISLEVGKASAVDVLKLQMRQNELEQIWQVLGQQFLTEQTTFNKLLNREKNTPVKVINGLIIPLKDSFINSSNLKLHPELIKYDKIYQSVDQSELLNKKESSPMLGFGVDYIAVSERPNMNFSDNGKDILMPMLSVSIPIFNKKYSSKSKQNKLKQQEIMSQKQERLNALETVLESAINNRTIAKIQYNTQGKNINQAKSAEQILRKSYQTGIVNFKDVLDIQELQLKFQINQIESVKMYYLQTAIIKYLSNF